MNAVTTPKTPRKPRTGFGDIDPTAAGRAAAASAAVSSRFQGLIDSISKDPSLTPAQRAAAIHSLPQQQSAEAAAVSKSIMDEARAAARARRNAE